MEPPALSQAVPLLLGDLQLYMWSCVPVVFKTNVQIIFIIQQWPDGQEAECAASRGPCTERYFIKN